MSISYHESGVSKAKRKEINQEMIQKYGALGMYRNYLRIYGGQIVIEMMFISFMRLCWEFMDCVESSGRSGYPLS